MSDDDMWSARVRRGFWHFYLLGYPAAGSAGVKVSNAWDCRFPMTGSADIVLSINVGGSNCTAFLRPPDGQPHEPVRQVLSPASDFLEQMLGVAFEPRHDFGFLKSQLGLGVYEPDNWSAIAEWFETARHVYRHAVDLARKSA